MFELTKSEFEILRSQFGTIKQGEHSKYLPMVFTESLNVKLEIEEIKKKLVNHDKNIELVFNYLDEMIEKQENKVERNKIGYKK